jgi:hypothetical protein
VQFEGGTHAPPGICCEVATVGQRGKAWSKVYVCLIAEGIFQSMFNHVADKIIRLTGIVYMRKGFVRYWHIEEFAQRLPPLLYFKSKQSFG